MTQPPPQFGVQPPWSFTAPAPVRPEDAPGAGVSNSYRGQGAALEARADAHLRTRAAAQLSISTQQAQLTDALERHIQALQDLGERLSPLRRTYYLALSSGQSLNYELESPGPGRFMLENVVLFGDASSAGTVTATLTGLLVNFSFAITAGNMAVLPLKLPLYLPQQIAYSVTGTGTGSWWVLFQLVRHWA